MGKRLGLAQLQLRGHTARGYDRQIKGKYIIGKHSLWAKKAALEGDTKKGTSRESQPLCGKEARKTGKEEVSGDGVNLQEISKSEGG